MFPSSSDKELKHCSGGRIEPCVANAGEVVNEGAITDKRFKMEYSSSVMGVSTTPTT